MDAPAPGLFRLPVELRAQILGDVLSAGMCSWVLSPYYPPAWGFPLHKNDPPHLDSCDGWDEGETFFEPRRGPDHAPIRGVLLSCRPLHHECLALLAERFAFIVQLNVRPDAPTGTNGFREIHALAPAFRQGIRSVVLHIAFLTPEPKGFWDRFTELMNTDTSPLFFERIVENINELLHLLPAVGKIHLVWDLYFGNSGMAMTQHRYSRLIWGRVSQEWPARTIVWTGQHCMGSFDPSTWWDEGLTGRRRVAAKGKPS